MDSKGSVIYSAITLGYWMEWAIMSSFSAVFLAGMGFGTVEIGYITTIAFLLSMFLQPMLASVADRSKKITLKAILTICFAVSLGCGIIVSFLEGPSAVAFVFSFVMISLTATVMPLLSAFCIQLNEAGMKVNFGIIRALGAVGYAVGGYLMGALTERFGAEIVLPTYCVIYTVVLCFMFVLRNPKTDKDVWAMDNPQDVKREQKSEQNFEDEEHRDNIVQFFSKHRRFALLLISLVFLNFMQFMRNTYLIYFVQNFGGNEGDMGTVLMVTSIAEIPLVALGIPVMKRFGAENMLRCHAVFIFLQNIIMLFVPNIQAYIVLHVIHIFSTGAYHVPIVYYAKAIVGKKDMVKAQAYVGAVYGGLVVMLANVLGGYMIDVMSIHKIIMIGSGITFIGAVILFFATSPRMFKKEKVRELFS